MALLGHKIVHTEHKILAPPHAVWSVLTSPAGYADWNPIFVQVQGEYREGAKMRYRMRDQNGKESDVTSTVIKFIPNQELNQFGGVRGVLTFDHTWKLEPIEGGTRVVQHEEYRGFGVWFWDASWVQPTYAKANQALEAYVLRTLGTH